MLEKPDMPDEKIIGCLSDAYGLIAVEVTFLPLGADQNTAVYRVVANEGTSYFVKLRCGVFDEASVIVPELLYNQGVEQVIPLLSTRSQALWTQLDEYTLIVSPFVEGCNGFELDLADHHWIDFGRALRRLHSAALPPDVLARIPRESFSAQWREEVRSFQAQVAKGITGDAAVVGLAALLKNKRNEIDELIRRAEQLAAVLQAKSIPFILCHADIHAGNLLIDGNDRLYIVDWDTLTLAPKERDLMFVGGGLRGRRHTPEEEIALFYAGYGQTQIDQIVLAYYRCERIVQDIAAYCEQILLTDEGGADRAEGLRQLASQFLPGQVVEIALKTGFQ